MGKRKIRCPLCHVKNKAWEENGFFAIESCKVCVGVPIIVMDSHTHQLETLEQANAAQKLVQKHYPGYQMTGPCSITKNLKHWHSHLSKR